MAALDFAPTGTARPRRDRGALVRRIGIIAASALAVTASLLATPAHADGPGWYQGIIRNWATGDCMDAFANVNPCYDGGTDPWQQWGVRQDWQTGFYYIGNNQTGGCLDNGNGLYMYYTGNGTCINGDAAQEWRLVSGNQYQGVFQNVLTGQCLDDDGQLYTNDCNFGGYQTWRWDGSL